MQVGLSSNKGSQNVNLHQLLLYFFDKSLHHSSLILDLIDM